MKTKQPIKQLLILLFLVGLGMGCEEEPPKVIADFTYEVTGEAPDAQISLTAQPENADKISWEITTPSASISRKSTNAPVLSHVFHTEEAGTHTVLLRAWDTDAYVQDTMTKKIKVKGGHTMHGYNDLSYEIIDASYLDTRGFFGYVVEHERHLVTLNFIPLPDKGLLLLSPDDSSCFDYSYVNKYFNEIFEPYNPDFSLNRTVINTEINLLTIEEFDNLKTDESIREAAFSHQVQTIYKEDLPKLVYFRTCFGYTGILKITDIRISYNEENIPYRAWIYYSYKYPEIAVYIK